MSAYKALYVMVVHKGERTEENLVRVNIEAGFLKLEKLLVSLSLECTHWLVVLIQS